MFRARDSTLVLESSALKVPIQTSATHTASYQQLPSTPYIKMIATHWYSPMKTSSITLLYSPQSTVHPQVIHAQ